VTDAVYAVEKARGAAGTHVVPSSRRAPSTRVPPALVTETSVISPLATEMPISLETGRSFAPLSGVIARETGVGGGPDVAREPSGPVAVPVHAASAATTMTAMAPVLTGWLYLRPRIPLPPPYAVLTRSGHYRHGVVPVRVRVAV
jgi:hypothetical protein